MHSLDSVFQNARTATERSRLGSTTMGIALTKLSGLSPIPLNAGGLLAPIEITMKYSRSTSVPVTTSPLYALLSPTATMWLIPELREAKTYASLLLQEYSLGPLPQTPKFR